MYLESQLIHLIVVCVVSNGSPVLPHVQPHLALSKVRLFPVLTQRDIHIFSGESHRSGYAREDRSTTVPRSSFRLADYMVCVRILSLASQLTSHLSAPILPTVIRTARVGSECKVMEGRTHLLDYTTHEVPLPLFGLGHDWACTFRGAPLPLRG